MRLCAPTSVHELYPISYKSKYLKIMHWFLLLFASSMGDEENLQLTHLPTCDVFLAPSTIPGSASVYVLCALLPFKYCILHYLVASVIIAFSRTYSFVFQQCAYRILVDCFTPSNLRLDSKQLVLEFLQDALSTNMRWYFGAG